MILEYGFSLIGTQHIKNGTVCQDYNGCKGISEGVSVMAVADGVGSSKHSDVASKLAVETLLEHVAENYDVSSDMTDLLKDAFLESKKAIEADADRSVSEYSDYDTTMSAVIYDGDDVSFGHSGDGGIIVLTDKGRYINITKAQKGADGFSVIPLRAGPDHWVFGNYEKVSSVLLATDGIYDLLMPYLLRGQDTEVYVPLARSLMDNNILNVNEKNILPIKADLIKFFESEQLSSVTDDKTVAVLINSNKFAEILDDKYYAVPDFDGLRREWEKKVHPYLSEKPTKETEPDDSEEIPTDVFELDVDISEKCCGDGPLNGKE